MKGEIKALVTGGKITPAALGQSLGMAGLNIGKVVADMNNATKAFAGMKVPVTISYDLKTKEYEIIVGKPYISQLLKQEAGVDKGRGGGAGEEGEDLSGPVGDLSFSQLLKVIEQRVDTFTSSKKNAVLQVLGVCVSMGLTVDGKDPKVVQGLVKAGEYDDQLA